MYRELKLVKAFRKNQSIKRILVVLILAIGIGAVAYFALNAADLADNPDKDSLMPVLALVISLTSVMMLFIFLVVWLIASRTARIYPYRQTLHGLNADRIKTVDRQFSSLYGKLFPVMYLDRIVFFHRGIFLQAIPSNDIVWMDVYTQAAKVKGVSFMVIALGTRQGKIAKISLPEATLDAPALAKMLLEDRPRMFLSVSGKVIAGRGLSDDARQMRKMFKTDFERMVKISDGIG